MHTSQAGPPSLDLPPPPPPTLLPPPLPPTAGGCATMNILLGVLALVGGYFILSLLRAIFFPSKAQPLEYKPRQVCRGSGRRWSF